MIKTVCELCISEVVSVCSIHVFPVVCNRLCQLLHPLMNYIL